MKTLVIDTMIEKVDFPTNATIADRGRIVELKNLERKLYLMTNGGWGSLFGTKYNDRKVALLKKVKTHTQLMFNRKYKTTCSYYAEPWKDGWIFFPGKWLKK